MENNKGKKLNIFLEILICIAAYYLLFYMGKYVYVTVVFIGVPFIYLIVRHGYPVGLAAYMVSLGLSFIFERSYTITLFFLTLLPVVTAGYMIREKKNVWMGVLFTGIAALAGIVMLVLFLHYLGDGEISSYITTLFVEKSKNSPYFRMMTYTMIITRNISSGISTMEILNMLEAEDVMSIIASEEGFISLKLIIEDIVPNVIALEIFYMALANFFASKYIAGKTGTKVTASMPFDEWKMPKDHGFYMLIIFVLGYVFMMLGESSYRAPGEIMVYLTTYIFRLVGATYIAHLIRPFVKSKAVRGIIGIAGYILLPNLVTIIGIADQLLDLRHRLYIKKL